VPAPQPIDFQALADGVVRNNVGVEAITLGVQGRLDGDGVVLHGTGQRLPVSGAQPTNAPWLWFDVRGYQRGGNVTLAFLRATATPAAAPATGPRAGAAPGPAVK